MTSMPASRSARAMILAPRSWPSSPGLATTTRIFRPSDIPRQLTLTQVKQLLLALLALAVLVAGCGSKRTSPVGIEDEVQDDRLFLYGAPETTAAQLESLGVDRVRITAGWAVIAPAAHSETRPRFDATDPAAYPAGAWTRLDRAVAAVTRHRMKPMLDVSFWAPRWAVQRDIGAPDSFRWRPDPVEFGKFAEAVARRYPQVRLWTTWNEPNHTAFLLPQWERRGRSWVEVAAHWYRAMHEQAYAAIKRVSKENRVLIGGLTSIGADRPGVTNSTPPLRFLRDMACVDASLRPLPIPECRGFHPLEADGFAMHPYMHKHPPSTHLPNPDSVGISDLDRLSSLLDRLRALGRIRQQLPIYVTEFGYETNPPDPQRGVPLLTQAQWLNQAAAIVYRRGDVRMFSQYLLRDVPENPQYQTGLELPDGQPKPSLLGWPLPFWIDGRDAIGRVRPGSGQRDVTLEMQRKAGWRAVGKPFKTGLDGNVRRRVTAPGTYRLRSGKLDSLPAVAR
jgi:hypothetical protein